MRKDVRKRMQAPDGIEVYLEVFPEGFQSIINMTSGIVTVAIEKGMRCGE